MERSVPAGPREAGDTREAGPVLVPHGALSAEALRGVVDGFVLKEGTDYGEHETAHAEKVHQVIAQLERGEASVVFDPGTGSVEIVTADALARARRGPR